MLTIAGLDWVQFAALPVSFCAYTQQQGVLTVTIKYVNMLWLVTPTAVAVALSKGRRKQQ